MAQVSIAQAIQLAVTHHQAGRLAEAEALYRQVLTVQPDHPDALHLLGVLAGQSGQLGVAVDLVRKAVERVPGVAVYRVNLGKFLADRGDIEEAMAAYGEAIRLQPGLAEAHNNLANLLKNRGRFAEAFASYRRAIEARPVYPEAHYNLGNAYVELGRFEEALASYREALRLRPNYAAAYNGIGHVGTFTGRYEEAVAACREALRLQPGMAEAWGNLGNALRDLRSPAEAQEAHRRALAINPGDAVCHSNLLLAMNYYAGSTRASLLAEAQRWRQQHAASLEAAASAHDHLPRGGRRLRVGYVSADFRSHPVAVFLESLLAHHDRSRYEVVCYCDARQPDAVTKRLQTHADLWRETAGLSHAELAELVRRDRVDVLIDLAMHSAYNRLLTFARKPAPVQGTWLAYPGTTGLTAIDFRITDRFLDPDDGGFSSERSAYVESFWCYRAPEEAPAVGGLPCATTGQITFGSLNNFSKASDGALDAWARIVAAVPGSRLLVHARSPGQREQVRDRFTRAGVDPARVEFLGRVPMREYFAAWSRVDIALDSFPCAGGTTTCDALYMGVPVITLAGEAPIARGGVSILANAGHAEWTASSVEEYEALAVGLANGPGRLADIRARLREELRASTLMDAPRFARAMEAVYEDAFARWSAAQRPHETS